MWQVKAMAVLSKFAGPLIGAALAVFFGLTVALWWTDSQLQKARESLAEISRDLLTCVHANETQRNAIALLEQAQERNRTQREDAIRRQQEALDRIAKLERERREQTTDTIERVVRIADGDACAGLPIPDRLRRAAGGD